MRTYVAAYMPLIFAHALFRMTTLEHAPHSVRRKGYAPHYTPTNIARFQPEMHEVTLELVSVRVRVYELISAIVDMFVTLDPREHCREIFPRVPCTLPPPHGRRPRLFFLWLSSWGR